MLPGWLLFLAVLWVGVGLIYLYGRKGTAESFYVKTIDDEITDLYLEVLDRQPSGEELVLASRRIQQGLWTLEGLRERLFGSEEYERRMKTQSNALAPELDRMLAEQRILETVSQIYLEERKKPIPAKMVHPLRDIYVELDYNAFAFRAFLRDPNYTTFEDTVMRMVNPSRDDVLALFRKSFNKDDLLEKGAQLKKEWDAANAKAGTGANTGNGAGAGSSLAGIQEAANARCVSDTDGDSKAMLDSIQKACANLFDKDAEAQCLDKNSKNIILTHHGDMVLRPEYEWSVPQQRPPVCTTLGQKPLVQPVMVNSSLLLGTPLDEAADTQVGSIMPKFKYTEYISVPGERLPTCAGGTAAPTKEPTSR